MACGEVCSSIVAMVVVVRAGANGSEGGGGEGEICVREEGRSLWEELVGD